MKPPKVLTRVDRTVVAALLWDVPALVSGSDGARAFWQVMGPGPWRPIEAEDAEVDVDPLVVAARGLFAERQGLGEDALRLYQNLAERKRYWPSLLGRFLLAWSDSAQDETALDAVVKQIGQLENGQVKARLLCKAASLALDRTRGQLFDSLLRAALSAAERESHLGEVLAYEAFNFGLSREFPGQFADYELDPLVNLDWIESLALRGSRGTLEDLLTARARSPWSFSFRSGRFPVHELVAAEEQARWAGAIWMRQALRRHAGAQILTGGGREHDLLLYGLNLWITGGGRDLGIVIDLVEPQLTSADGIDDLVEAVHDPRPRTPFPGRKLAEVALPLWDLLSDEALLDALDRASPSPEEPVEIDLGRRLWGVASWRVPHEVEVRIAGLSSAAQIALLEHIPASGLDSFSAQTALRLVTLVEGMDGGSGGTLGAAARLAARVGKDPSRLIARVQPFELADALSRYPDGAKRRQVSEAERALRERLQTSILESRRGTYSFGPRSAAGDLAALAVTTSQVTRQSVRALVRAAAQDDVPARIRFESLMALARLGHAGLLTADDARAVSKAPDFGSPSSFLGPDISAEVIRAAKLLVRSATTRIGRAEEAQILLLVRDEDPRARQLAVNAACVAIAKKPSERLEASVLAALYDPDQETVERAIVGIQNAKFTSPIALRAALQRFSGLMEQSNRGVRSQLAHAAKLLAQGSGAEVRSAKQIVQVALQDRSWVVRHEAMTTASEPHEYE